MNIGVVFPQTELGGDVGAVRAYADAVSGLGYTHVLAYDHVVGADPDVHKPWNGPYDVHTTFHEPFVLFGYLAAITSLELVTGIIILPQRQTALVAKQAAEVDLLAQGRLRLGVAIGWNEVEYVALGKNFHDRGKRLVEQVQLLRKLWSEQSVTFEGHYEQVIGAGLSPMPIQQPIPLWFGANSEPALRRAGELADGWFPQRQPGAGLEEQKAILDQAARDAGRVPEEILMEGRLNADASDPDTLAAQAKSWQDAGASHLSLNTMRAGHNSVDEHIAALAAAAEVLL